MILKKARDEKKSFSFSSRAFYILLACSTAYKFVLNNIFCSNDNLFLILMCKNIVVWPVAAIARTIIIAAVMGVVAVLIGQKGIINRYGQKYYPSPSPESAVKAQQQKRNNRQHRIGKIMCVAAADGLNQRVVNRNSEK